MKLKDLTKKKTLVIAGFPGIGKTFFKKNLQDKPVLDSDSSKFSWDGKVGGKRNPDFPNNYITHIQSSIGTVDIICVSTHDNVRDGLESNDIDYTLIYPDITLKDEYEKRYKDRNNDSDFINFIIGDWNTLITALKKETFPKHIVLKKGEYLGDVIK